MQKIERKKVGSNKNDHDIMNLCDSEPTNPVSQTSLNTVDLETQHSVFVET